MYWLIWFYFLSLVCFHFFTNGLLYEKSIFAKEESEICETQEDCKYFCLTKGCILSTAILLDSMKPSVDPCEDFIQFSCGGFFEKNSPTYKRPIITTKEEAKYDLLTSLDELLYEPCIPGEPIAFTKVKEFYRSCMNTTKIEQEGSTPLRTLIVQLGGWPVISGKSWKEERFDWLETLIQLQKLGIRNLIFDVHINETIPVGFGSVIQLRRPLSPVLINEMKSGMESEMVRNYYSYLVNMTVRIGAQRSDAERDFKEVIRFLAITEDLFPRNNSKHSMTVKNLNNSIQKVNWLKYLNAVLPFRITENVKIEIDNFNYFGSIVNIIDRFPKRVIANYLMWELVNQGISFLSSDYINLQHQLLSSNVTSSSKGNRFDKCLEETLKYFRVGLTSMYTLKYFKKEDQKEIEEMTFNIQDKFREFLKRNHWMNEEEKQRIIDKLYTIGLQVGFTDALFNSNLIDQYYRSMKINTNNYLLNSLILQRHRKYEKLLTYLKPQIYQSGLTAIQHIPLLQPMAFISNQLTLNTFGLHLLFYRRDIPKYIQYAIAGAAIGEEIFHILFNFDIKNSNEAEISWINSTSEKPTMRWIIDVYQNLTKDIDLDDFKKTFAQIVGFKVAYEAYKEWNQKHKEESNLPNINQNSIQLLWIFNSQYHCEANISQKQSYNFLIDSQAAEKILRIKEQLQLLKYFNEDFHCNIQVNMNTTKKEELIKIDDSLDKSQ